MSDEELKFVAFNGSPRKEGRTAGLLSVVLEELRGLGAETRLIHLVDNPIRPCLGCFSNSPEECEPRRCTEGELEDAMKGYHQLLLYSDGVIFATPVMWFGPSGLMKNFIDRMTSLENAGKLLDGRVAGFVVTGDEDGAMQTVMQLMGPLSEMGFLFPPYPFATSLGFKNVMEDREALEFARRLGRNLYRLAGILKKKDFNWWGM
ncbi:MAG: FMN reductase [Candidatus Hydrothermota bacterium]|nr:MAG: FMN reductase [Candidatus Hydrothermae bacterium]